MIAVTMGGERWEECQKAYPGVVPFYGTEAKLYPPDAKRDAIADTYHRLAVLAVEEKWDGVLVIQDDVRFRGEIPDGYGIFGRWRGRGHWCPQAFRFSPTDWEEALDVWDGEIYVCQAWVPIVDRLPRFDLASDRDEAPLPAKRAEHYVRPPG